jgi:CarD family transcriptional regulator
MPGLAVNLTMFRSERQPKESYSERQLSEAALDCMTREISAVRRIEETTAVTEIENVLEKFSRRGDKGEESAAERAA